jgi:predicted nucleotidyltransferase
MNLNEYKILNLMYKEARPLFFREISKLSEVSIGGTQKVLGDYSSFLIKEPRGKNTYFSFKSGILSRYLKSILENERRIYFLMKNKKLKDFFEKLIQNNFLCLIFGSFARGNNSKNSDLDLIIISGQKVPEHLCSLNLHVIELSKKNFETLFRKKDVLALELSKDHILMNGLDYFMGVFEKYEKN